MHRVSENQRCKKQQHHVHDIEKVEDDERREKDTPRPKNEDVDPEKALEWRN